MLYHYCLLWALTEKVIWCPLLTIRTTSRARNYCTQRCYVRKECACAFTDPIGSQYFNTCQTLAPIKSNELAQPCVLPRCSLPGQLPLEQGGMAGGTAGVVRQYLCCFLLRFTTQADDQIPAYSERDVTQQMCQYQFQKRFFCERKAGNAINGKTFLRN